MAALFWPDCLKLLVRQARHMLYHRDRARMSRYFGYGENARHRWP